MTKKDNYILLLLVTAVFALFFRQFCFGKTLYIRDLTYIFHPWKHLCSEIIINGQMPLWNRFSYSGMPLMANMQTGVFYPFSLLFYFFSFPKALKLYSFIHICLAGIFTYLFARKNAFKRSSSASMAVIFALGGFIITKLEFLSHIGVDIWIFLLLLFIKNPLLLAAGLSFSFFAGHQIVMFQVIILCLYYIMHSYNGTLKSAFSSFKFLAVTGFFAILLTACQLFPAIELSAFSARINSGISESNAMIHSLNISDFIKFITPCIKQSSGLVTGEVFQWDTAMYIGLTGTLLALIGLFQRFNKRLKIFAFFLIILGVIISMGKNTNVYPFLYNNLIIFKMLRYPVQLIYFAIVGITIIAGFGAQKLKYSKYLIFLLLAELFCYSYVSMAVTGDKYYYKQHNSIAHLQQNIGFSRFIISPGTETNRHIKGKSIDQAWQRARGTLYNLTSIPYHLKNAYGFGEPLSPNGIENYIDKTYSINAPDKAYYLYRNIGIKYILSKNRFPNNRNYTLSKYTDGIFIYELKNSFKYPLFLHGIDGKIYEGLNLCSYNEDYAKAAVTLYADNKTELLYSQNFFPGWNAYLNKKGATIGKYNNLLSKVALEKGVNCIVLFYKPYSFISGLFVTITSLFTIILIAFKNVYQYQL